MILRAGGGALEGVSEGYWPWVGFGREMLWGGQGNGPVMALVREVLRPNQGLSLQDGQSGTTHCIPSNIPECSICNLVISDIIILILDRLAQLTDPHRKVWSKKIVYFPNANNYQPGRGRFVPGAVNWESGILLFWIRSQISSQVCFKLRPISGRDESIHRTGEGSH